MMVFYPSLRKGKIVSQKDIQELEQQVAELTAQLKELYINNSPVEVSDYSFETEFGEVKLSDLFGNQDTLFVIHNMGDSCRYCTLWADGLNGFLAHLESAMSVVLVSKDSPAHQRKFANSRGWNFRLASHHGGKYAEDHTQYESYANMPGAAVYQRSNGKIIKKNACLFGPGDLYCSIWNVIALAGIEEENWTPQYRYWTRPEKLEDGGQNVVD